MKNIFFKKDTENGPACRQAGFTFIELSIYTAIFSTILLILTEIFVGVLNVQLESESTSSVHQDGRFIMARLTYDIQNAESIATPSAIGLQTDNLGIKIGGVDHTYRIDNGNLELTNSLGTSQLNSVGSSVSAATFKRLGNTNGVGTIQIDLTVKSTTLRKKGPEIQTFQTTVGLR